MKSKNKKVFILFFLFSLSFFYKTKASDYYWVGGTGNWSDYSNHWATTSGGLIYHTTIPTANDDVFFDANSFTIASNIVTVDSTFIYCHNMNWTGAQFNPSIINLAGTTPQIKIYGSLTLVQGMQFEIYDVVLLAAAGVQTITSHGTEINHLSFSGTATYNLADDLSVYDIVFFYGTFNSGNHAITASATLRIIFTAINLGTSLITCNAFEFDEDPVSFTSSAASVVFPNNGEIFTGSGAQLTQPLQFDSLTFLGGGAVGGWLILNCNYLISTGYFQLSNNFTVGNQIDKAVFLDDARIETNTVFDSLRFNNPGHVLEMMYGNPTLTINQGFVANGTCGQPFTISGGTLSKPSGSVTVNYIVLINTVATGGAAFTANNSVDAGGNSGWTINAAPPHNLYWVGGSGNWSDPSHWALSSGGAGGSCVPSLNDDVYFDANSFSAQDTVTLDVPTGYCHNLNFTGAQFNPLFTYPAGTNPPPQLKIYGSCTLVQGLQFQNTTVFIAPSGTQTITSHGASLGWVYFNGTGAYNLADDFTCDVINFFDGSFNSNNHAITVSGNIRIVFTAINLGTSLITCNAFEFDEDPVSFTSSAASVVFPNNGEIFTGSGAQLTQPLQFDSLTFLGGGAVGGWLILNCNYLISTGYFQLSNNFTVGNQIDKAVFLDDARIETNTVFDSLRFNNPGHVLEMMYGNPTLTINQGFVANGTCGQPFTISGGTLSKPSGSVTVNYIVLINTVATGGAAFTANNSVDAGGNSGWTINAAPPHNLYWVGGSGNWSDPSHWALSSGGAGGSCVPSLNDDVYFDANSFSAQDTVTLDVPTGYCHNLNFTGAQFNPLFTYPAGTNPPPQLKIYGSCTLVQGLQFQNTTVFIAPSGTQTITSHGASLGWVYFNGTGAYNLADDFTCDVINFFDGSFNSNNHAITVSGNIRIVFTAINLGTSLITCNAFEFDEDPVSFTSSAASVVFPNNGEIFTGSGAQLTQPLQFDSLTFLGGGAVGGWLILNCNYLISTGYFQLSNNFTVGNQIDKAVFLDDARIETNTVFDSLLLNNPGHVLQLMYGNPILTINYALIASLSPAFPIEFSGGTISKSSGQVCLDYLIMQNTTATGGAQFFAGSNSVDLGGNSGWSFTNCSPYFTNVWPGDANYDLIADNFDILNIGVAYGNTGTTRAGANLSWTAQPSQTWLTQFITGVNLNNADCDGNGVVNALDTLAVSLNYGLTHPFRLSSNENTTSTGTDLYFDMPSGSLVPGSNVSIPINFGTTANPANNVYGIAFTINYDPAFIQAGSMYLDYTGSWAMTPLNNYIHIEKDFSATGDFDAGMSRINHQNVSGSGLIATLHFTVANNASGLLTLSFSDVLAISNNEIPIPVNPQGGSVPTGIDEFAENGGFSFYPNPVNDYLYFGENNSSVSRVMIYDCFGQLVADTFADRKKIFLGNLSKGIYMLSAFDIDNQKIFTKKFMKD